MRFAMTSHRYGIVAGLGGLIIALDQASKIWVLSTISAAKPFIEVTSFLNIVLVWNRGISFGVLNRESAWQPWVLVGIAVRFCFGSWAYRLPTVAEWRYACAALTTSRRYYGWTDELADDHFRHFATSGIGDGDVRYFPAGDKRPNDFGMFSMYDGVREWVHDRTAADRHVVCGYTNSSEVSWMATIPERRTADLSKAINGYYGLRIARTVVGD